MKKIIFYGVVALTSVGLPQLASAGPIVLKPRTDANLRDLATKRPVSDIPKYKSWSITDQQLPVKIQGCQNYGGPPSAGNRSWWYCGKFSVNGSTTFTLGEYQDNKVYLDNGFITYRKEHWTAELPKGCSIKSIYVYSAEPNPEEPIANKGVKDFKATIDPNMPWKATIDFTLYLDFAALNSASTDRNQVIQETGKVQLAGKADCPEDMSLVSLPQ